MSEQLNTKFKNWVLKHWDEKYNLTKTGFDFDSFKEKNNYTNFPYTYNDLYQLYLIKDSLCYDFSIMGNETKEEKIEKVETKNKNYIGSVSLESIGEELDLTIAGVKQIESSGKQKLNFFALKDKENNLKEFDIDDEEWNNNLHRAISTYITYFDISKQESNIKSFLSTLEIAGYITKNELPILIKQEKEVHEYIHEKLFQGQIEFVRAFIEEDLLSDFEDSMLKSFQNVLAKTWNEQTGFVKEKKKKKTIDDF
jgi:hypothetical protein